MMQISVDASDWEKTLNKLLKEMPKVSKKAMRKVNSEVKKRVKKESRSRGYKAHKQTSWGDAGYQKNLFSYVNKDFSVKIMIGKNAFQYKFVEYGANVKPRHKKYLTFIGEDGQFHKTAGFTLNANPLLRPIADAIWKTDEASKIMEQVLQKELDKIDKTGGNK